jgi:succinate dehydrogenase / fumarate reductase cytochrome b subunit
MEKKDMPELKAGKALRWGEADPYRRERAHAGMWAWLLQRISAVCIIILLCLHLVYTYKPLVQFLLLLVLAFHAALGVRVILLDFNLVKVKYQRYLIPWVLGVGLILFIIAWCAVY